jgi:neutral trehalase
LSYNKLGPSYEDFAASLLNPGANLTCLIATSSNWCSIDCFSIGTIYAFTSIMNCRTNTMLGVLYLLQLEHDISKFAKMTGDNSTSKKFLEASKSREVAIRSLLWNHTLGQWVDYWLDKNDSRQVLI